MQGADGKLIDSLTSIRFFAAMIVVTFHAGAGWALAMPSIPGVVSNFLLNGYVGVTLFFVLSGFILQIVYRGKFDNRRQLYKYGIARVARVYPVYLLATLLAVSTAPAFNLWSIPQFLLLQSWTTLPLVQNWNGPAWTLSVELLFYLLFPLLSKMLNRSALPLIYGTFVAMFLIILIWHTSATPQPPTIPDWRHFVPSCLARLPEFVLGVAAGELYLRSRDVAFGVRPDIIVAAMIAVLLFTSDWVTATGITLLAPFLISALARGNDNWLAAVFNNRVLVLLGGASYALYLIHQPVRSFVGWVVNEDRHWLLLQYPVVIATAVIVFLYFEEPLREWIRNRAGFGKSTAAEIAPDLVPTLPAAPGGPASP